MNANFRIFPIFIGCLIISVTLSSPSISFAQVLEEVLVTAQRREQSLQDVPLAIETYSGDDVVQQNFRGMQQLGEFSPTIVIEGGTLETNIRVRGMGTSGRAFALEQAVPTFVDGIHYGRSSQIKTAFLDVERVEVLKGPQPVYFGQNATAGAFNITSRKPTTEWEGYGNAEYGNFGESTIEAAIGGPVTDTIGIRVAGKYETGNGFVTDIVTDEKLGLYRNKGGRVILQWTPTDNFEATAKFDISDLKKDPEAAHVCVTEGNARHGRREDPSEATPTSEGNGASVWLEYPKGSGTAIPHTPLDSNCFGSDKGIGDHYFAPEVHVRVDSGDSGMIDIRDAVTTLALQETGAGIQDIELLESNSGYLNLLYRFNNGIEANWLNSFSNYNRDYKEHNRGTPYFLRYQNRREDLAQISSEFRVSSPTGGMFEWNVGLYWQQEDYDIGMRSREADVRRGYRDNVDNWLDSEWKSVFGSVTFNFLDDMASIDVGGRYADIDKDVFVKGVGGTWVFDVTPCAPGPNDHLGGGDIDPDNCAALHPDAVMLDPSEVVILVEDTRNGPVDLTNLWTLPWRDDRTVPPTWRGDRAQAIGRTIPDPSVRNGPHSDLIRESEFDPQVTLRFRPTDNISLFARWAQAFKAGGWDTGVTSIPEFDEFGFDSETGESFEVGAKGTFWDGRGRFDLTIYEHTVDNLQLATADPDPDSAAVSTNAGGQRTRGIEFGVAAAISDRLTVGLNGAIMDAVMTDFVNAGCTDREFLDAPSSGCDPDTGTIDRTGQSPPFAPDWKFVLDVNYEYPVLDSYIISLDAKGYISDGYHSDPRGFSQVVRFDSHEDLNLILSFGDQENTWVISGYARNILEPRPSYHPENDIEPDGLASGDMSANGFTHYGLKFRYNFR